MQKTKKRAITGFGIALLLVLGFVIFFFFNCKSVVVSGVSMLPNFKSGQRVLVCKAYWLIGAIKPNDVVVIREDSPLNTDGYIIKRVYKMPGETVDYAHCPKNYSIANGEFKVPSGSIYVLGDNAEQSEDSRFFGPVELTRVIGKVVVRP